MTIWISMLLLLTPSGAFATPAMHTHTTSQRDIIYPEESYDECFMDEGQQLPGVCRKLQDCPTGLHRWQHENLTPKNCYFVKFDQYVCCELDKSNLQATECPTLPTTPGTRRPSAIACNPSNRQFAVGGVPTIPNEFPYMAALGWRSNYDQRIIVYRCGGALISPRFVLTAAHCIDFGGDVPSTVLLGGNNLTLSTNEQFKIRRVIVHPSYNGNTQYNDIALLELDIIKEPKQKPACLWDGFNLRTGLIAVGYGQTQFAGKSSAQLLKVSLNYVSNEQCQLHYPEDILPLGVISGQLCAGDPTRMQDTCQGDSGGPLISLGVFQYVVGITSLGQGCARGPPSIYTRVSHYLDWIEGIVWPTNV